MQCNIDAKGKAARFVIGVILCIFGGCAIGVHLFRTNLPDWLLIIAAAFVIGGAFAVFEAWAGWCVIRAFGIQTRI